MMEQRVRDSNSRPACIKMIASRRVAVALCVLFRSTTPIPAHVAGEHPGPFSCCTCIDGTLSTIAKWGGINITYSLGLDVGHRW